MEDVVGMLRGDADPVIRRGDNLLGSLFGDNIIGNLAGMLGRYSGLAGDAVKKLLALLAPLVLGKIATVWKAKGGTQLALTELFDDQRRHIADAMPAGFSLADIPGWSTVTSAASTASAGSRRVVGAADAATRSAAGWAVPLALGVLALFLIWMFMRPQPEETAQSDVTAQSSQEVVAQKPVVPDDAPNVTEVSDDLSSIFTTAGDVMGQIKDAASATAARPKLEELSRQLDDAKSRLASLPETGLASVRTMANKAIATIKDQAERTLETPGLPAEITALINQILQKLTTLFPPAAR
jgi:hypothetical protein